MPLLGREDWKILEEILKFRKMILVLFENIKWFLKSDLNNYIIILNYIINTKIYQSDFYNDNFISKKKNSIRNTNINYNITNLEYSFSFKYNLIKIKYDIIFYDENRALIKPSDLSLYYNLHILCQIEIIKTGEIIYSIGNIYENKNFYCTEYNKIDESITYGIKIYEFHNDIDIYYKIFFLMDTYNYIK